MVGNMARGRGAALAALLAALALGAAALPGAPPGGSPGAPPGGPEAPPAQVAVGNSAVQKCRAVSKGDTTTDVRPLDDVVLDKNQRNYDVTLPADACSPVAVVGSALTACDNDVAPSVEYSDVLHATVGRNGDYAHEEGVLHSYVYCAEQ